MFKRYHLLIFGLLLIVIGFIGINVVNYYDTLTRFVPTSLKSEYSSNGERIYYTGVSKRGKVSFRGGPMWLKNHGGSCVSCHGEDGHGGLQIMMVDEITPDITYETLTEEEHKEHDEAEEEHPPYNDKLIKWAITQGLNPSGDPLDWMMPRWDMNSKDFEDLLKFLKELSHE